MHNYFCNHSMDSMTSSSESPLDKFSVIVAHSLLDDEVI